MINLDSLVYVDEECEYINQGKVFSPRRIETIITADGTLACRGGVGEWCVDWKGVHVMVEFAPETGVRMRRLLYPLEA